METKICDYRLAMIAMDYVALVNEQRWCSGKNARLPPM